MVYVPSGAPSPIDALCAPVPPGAPRYRQVADDTKPPTLEETMRWHPRLRASTQTAAADAADARAEDVVLQLRRPRCLARFVAGEGTAAIGDTWVWWFSPDLMRMLMHPLGGGMEPLGREFHPAARVANGAMIYAGMRAAAGCEPIRLAARYRKAPLGTLGFTLYSRVISVGADGVAIDHALFEDGALVSDGRLTCRRSQGPAVEYAGRVS